MNQQRFSLMHSMSFWCFLLSFHCFTSPVCVCVCEFSFHHINKVSFIFVYFENDFDHSNCRVFSDVFLSKPMFSLVDRCFHFLFSVRFSLFLVSCFLSYFVDVCYAWKCQCLCMRCIAFCENFNLNDICVFFFIFIFGNDESECF